ncbi:MAG: glucosidase [Gemmatimonadetes bacterium]|nr:glucosidase [Gemmatimonadota bacterium]
MKPEASAETARLLEDAERRQNWKRWGPYLAERQWGTVREDYSAYGSVWDYLPHDHARSRAYRWGEDGLLGITDRENRLCFALALWNGRDPILKERLFGLTGPEGNHGEDVKESYYYLDATPTHSYLRGLYKYAQSEYPYARLVQENARRSAFDREFELVDTGAFDDDRYFDVFAEYAKAAPDDILIRITIANRGPEDADLHLLPTLWFRNTWSWGRSGDGIDASPRLTRSGAAAITAEHATLGRFVLRLEPLGARAPDLLFTNNDTNTERLFGSPNESPFVKDAFHEYVVHGRGDAVNPAATGTKAAAHYRVSVPAQGRVVVRCRLTAESIAPVEPFGASFDEEFEARIREGEAFWADRLPAQATDDERNVLRQAYAGLLWSKQFFHYIVRDWLDGDPAQPAPPQERRRGRNADWLHLHNRDIISMPDKWEYPWYAAWDLAFHMIPFAGIDAQFTKDQLVLFLREWYMHPNGQLPAYEFAFGDVNPPVHAWACWRAYKMTGARGQRDRAFLERTFQKLLLNFTWWVNRKDIDGHNLFAGGFLGLDNIGVFDRSQALPTGGHLEQADGTAWMAFYCGTMLSMALELAREDAVYEDLASKFFEHFIAITDAMNTLGGTGLWDEQDGFYYDQLHVDGRYIPLRLRSMVGVIPLFAVEILDEETIQRLPGFAKRMRWFLENRPELAERITCMEAGTCEGARKRLLAVPTRARLERVLRYVLDENELLSPWGVRSVSRVYGSEPYVLDVNGAHYTVEYDPAEGTTRLFGGNSNWRGPVWFPLNYLLIEALERYHHFYGDALRVEFPVGSGHMANLGEVANELTARLTRMFLRDGEGRRACHGNDTRYATDAAWQDLVLFHEYFDAETGRGLGASHQTGWTALAAKCIEAVAGAREAGMAGGGQATRASHAGSTAAASTVNGKEKSQETRSTTAPSLAEG